MDQPSVKPVVSSKINVIHHCFLIEYRSLKSMQLKDKKCSEI